MTMAKKAAVSDKKQVSLKQMANKAATVEKNGKSEPAGKISPKTKKDSDASKTTLLQREKTKTPDQLSRKESLAVLMIPKNEGPQSPRTLKTTGSRLSVTSTRRLSVESHRSLDFPHQIGNVATATMLPEADDKMLTPATDDSYIRSAIPYLPIPVAVICLILNIVTPGLGTILGGFCIFCCGRPRVRSKGDEKSTTCCVCLFVGLAQLWTVTLCLVGWAWSIAWGVIMVDLAAQYNREKKQKRQLELQALALSAFATNEAGRPKLPF